MVVFFSGCADCSLNEMKALVSLGRRRRDVNVRAVFPEPPSWIRDFFSERKLDLDSYSHHPEHPPSKYNAVWSPRVYAIDASSRLIYTQPSGVPFASALTIVESLLAKKAHSRHSP